VSLGGVVTGKSKKLRREKKKGETPTKCQIPKNGKEKKRDEQDEIN